MSKPMTDFVDPLRVAADRVIRKIAEASVNHKTTIRDAGELLIWIGNELLHAVQEHDNLNVQEVISNIGISSNAPDFTVTNGFIIDESEIRRLNHKQDTDKVEKRYMSEATVLEQIFGKGMTIDKVAEFEEIAERDEDGQFAVIKEIANILEIDLEDIASFEPKDPNDYFDFEEWMDHQGAKPEEIEAEIEKLLTTRLRSISRRRAKRVRR
jgi:hypothetical protein